MRIDPDKSIHGSIAGYTADAVERMTELSAAMSDLRWRMRRGEPEEMKQGVSSARKATRQLMHDLDMLKFCIEGKTKGDAQ
jgi:hypothetical protein